MKYISSPYVVSFYTALLAFAGIAFFAGAVFLHKSFAQVDSGTVDQRRAQLQAELTEIEKEIAAQRTILAQKQRETVSLERDVAILDAQINESELSIRARNLTIQKLGTEINDKEEIIGSLSKKLSREKESLAQILRKTNEIDSFSLVEVIFSNKDLSEFFVDLDSFDSIKAKLQNSFVAIEETKKITTTQKRTLEEKKIEETQLRTLQELQKNRIEEKRSKRKRILSVTKGQERAYQKILENKQRDAASIRSELFTLRGTAAIPFGKALDLANKAFAKTGVRPALILGIITEETNLGENVGTGTWTVDMKAPRDTEPFKAITKSLGFNPDVMPVSRKPWYGYGGAMGPAQFIPSTWVLYAGYEKTKGWAYNPDKDRIGKLTGNRPPNPWDPEDAFMASAVLLRDNGATKTTSTCRLTNNPEKCAALRYFAGWKNANKSTYQFYGDDVIELAAKMQRQIDILQR